MIKRIRELEKTANELEPSAHERKETRKEVVNYTEAFLKEIGTVKAFVNTPDRGIALLDSPISENPIEIGKAIELLQKNVDTPGLNPASGGHLGYIPGGGLYYSALGDYMADIFNRYSGFYFTSPGAVRLENMLLRWMCELVGYPKTAAGNLTSGGSLANLSAIVTARDAQQIRARDIEKGVIYMTEHAHHCIAKAIRIAGLGESVIRQVPLDDQRRMDCLELEKQIMTDRKAGLRPWLVIASAGTTDTGNIDPLANIGRIAKKYSMWFHIDAAYGGFFMLCPEGKKKLAGLELSDSLVMDPHKGLFLPYGLGVVLVKKSEDLERAHHYMANYLQDAKPEHEEELSPANLSAELTKHFRGLRLWLPLKLHGLKPFRAALEEKLLLAQYFYKEVQKLGFETGPEPELSVVTYRYIPKTSRKLTEKEINDFNERLVAEVQGDGRVFISSTLLGTRFTLR
ncbi:MAG TPA: aminotransferase class V-fold PLP-dependent enzyme, partial [Bacteroidia bacterium]|nr:aminotransferase class V-fold PLP-dependent enzyme [Bacteroidia bacterium]